MKRRQVIVAALAGGLAGCVDAGGDGGDPNAGDEEGPGTDAEPTETPTPTPTDTPTPTGTPTPRETTTDDIEVPEVETTESSVESGNDRVDEFLSNAPNYDGIEDHTGESEVPVGVGVETSSGPYGFGPAAVRISTGTTVTWEWTGEGGYHNVRATEGAEFESDLTGSEGHTFEHTFSEPGTVLYVCTPHQGMGMKGAVVVE